MDEESPIDLVEDRFDDVSIEDAPVDDNGSFYNEQDYVEEEEVEPTNENFNAANRYKPSNRNTRDLPTIKEEKHDDLRSNTSSRVATRPPSVLSDKSNDLSNQFGFGAAGNAIDQFTDQFYSEKNKAERLFPEHELVDKGFMSPAKDKQNSWEPSVYHYEKQPTPEVQNNSPGLVFANLTQKKEQQQPQQRKNLEKKENVNNENLPRRDSPERSIFITSPCNSTTITDVKTSTPKRPGTFNRLGNRNLPQFECSTIYELSPQRSAFGSRAHQSRYQSNPTAGSSSDTMPSNRTMSDSVVQKVISGGGGVDQDLMLALENARKKREQPTIKPDFRLNTTHSRGLAKASTVQPLSTHYSAHPSTSIDQTASRSQSIHTRFPQPSEVQLRNEMTNTNTTSVPSNLSRLSTAKSREDLSKSTRSNHGYSSTMIPNSSNSMSTRDGRESVVSVRTVSRASSTMTVGGTSGNMKPLRIAASRLSFGVVPVNESLTMELEIENISDRQCRVQSYIDSDTTVYQVVDNKLTIVEPRKTTKLKVSFTPASVGRYQVLLIIGVAAQNFTQSIPVWGIGGVANILPVPTKDLLQTANQSEFAMFASNISRISFKLSNATGHREAFALMTVYDAHMRPLPRESVSFYPSRGVTIGRKVERKIDIRIDVSQFGTDEYRTSSVMSTASTASSVPSFRRRAVSGADFVIEVAWGEEILRQRLKLLESRPGYRQQPIDGIWFTSQQFADEEPLRPPPKGFPSICMEDADLFASSYRTFYINVFSSTRGFAAFRSATAHSNMTTDTSVLEVTAFRHQTFVNDATMMPMSSRTTQ